jgi:AraC-like DNA-binding protein
MESGNILKPFDRSEALHRWIPSEGAKVLFGCGFKKKDGISLDHDGNYFRYAAIYVLHGSGLYIDHLGREHQLGPGTVFQRFENTPHKHVIDPDSGWLEFFWGYYICPLGSKQVSTVALNALGVINQAQPVFRVAIDPLFLGRCNELLQELKSASDETLRQIPLKGALLLNELFLGAEKTATSGVEDHVARACTLIRENMANRTPLPIVLGRIPISYSRLRSLFRQRMGIGMNRYQIQCRIDHAIALLSKRIPVKVVAKELGYGDQFAFSAQFKKVTGLTPKKSISG